MLKFVLFLALALSALLAACSGGEPPTTTATDHPIKFVMEDQYGLEQDIEIQIRNNGDRSYRYHVAYPACFDLKFHDDSKAQHQVAGRLLESRTLPPGEFIIPQGTHCDLPGTSEVGPGEVVPLLT